MFPADLIGTLQGINVEEETIREIVKILENSATDLHSGKPKGFSGTALGGSWSASNLDFHTRLAHKHVVKAMEQMVAGLDGYQANVKKFHEDMTFVDTDASDAQKRTLEKLDGVVPPVSDSESCAAPTGFDDNEQCTIPTGDQ